MDYSLPGSSVSMGILVQARTGVGCHALLQGIFLIQGLNPYLTASPALAGGFFTTTPPYIMLYIEHCI